MWWDDPNDSENMQRFKNQMFMHAWMTNETRDDAMPVLAVLLLIGVIVWVVIAGVSR